MISIARIAGALFVLGTPLMAQNCASNPPQDPDWTIHPWMQVECRDLLYGCHWGGGVSFEHRFDLNAVPGARSGNSVGPYLSAADFDASQLKVDVGASTVGAPQQGTVVVHLVVSSTGVVVAEKTFSWQRSGSIVAFSNPVDVNYWIQSHAGNADEVTFTLNPFTPGGQGTGLNTFATTAKYDYQTAASASSSWVGVIDSPPPCVGDPGGPGGPPPSPLMHPRLVPPCQ